jgi:hypothetical protein
MSAVEIEWRLFNASRQIGDRSTGVDSGGVETFMAQQLRQLDQLARMPAQPGKRESMAQTVGGDVGAGQAGPPNQGGNGILNRAHRHCRALTRPEHCGLGRCRKLLFEQLTQGAAGRGIQRNLTFLQTLAIPYSNRAGAFAKHNVSPSQCRHLADPQASLKHELDQSVIAPRKPVRTLARSAQQAMHLRGRETKWAGFADDTHRLDVDSDIASHSAIGFRPAQQPA